MNRIMLFLVIVLITTNTSAQKVTAGATETTPSSSQYCSWLNNTNEGATVEQTLINLDFFKWLKDDYGMILDIYSFDAGAVDGKNFCGSMNSQRFRNKFPDGFGPLSKVAAKMGTRLGLWGGPDGFGNSEEEEQARIEERISLCRDFNFKLLKFDGVCGRLRPEKYDAFDRMMTQCREYTYSFVKNAPLIVTYSLDDPNEIKFEGTLYKVRY